MALLFCDSFDHYTVTSQAARKGWSGNFGSAGTGRNGTTGVNVNSNASNIISFTSGASFVMGAAVFLGANSGAIFAFHDTGTFQCELRVDISDMSLDVTRNISNILGSSAAGVVTNAGYQYIEFKVTIGNAGSAEVRVNEVVVLTIPTADTQNTANATANQATLRGAAGNAHLFDDFYLASGTSYFGDIRVKAIFPDGAGNYTQWTPTAGSNYQCVDETPANDDTDYVSSLTAAQKDTYGFGAVGISGNVKGVQLLGALRKDDAGARSVRRLIRIGGADYTGSNISIGTSYTYGIREILENNPATAAPWAISEIDAAEFGIELVS